MLTSLANVLMWESYECSVTFTLIFMKNGLQKRGIKEI